MAQGGPRSFIFEGMKTLPLHWVMGRTQEAIPQFSSGKVRIEIIDPGYVPLTYSVSQDWLRSIGRDSSVALKMVKHWPHHLTQLLYFIQLRDDSDHSRMKALHGHTELLSALCDGRLHIDTGALWHTFDQIHGVELVHTEYRHDPKREDTYGEYVDRLDAACKRLGERQMEALRLIQRISKQVELKAGQWERLPPLHVPPETESVDSGVKLFCSYSHKDETLRDALSAHLALLKRQHVIEEWHDRRIIAGQEFDKEIDAHLESASLILLLISADFVNSNYCWSIEVHRAMERHEAGTATVIPVILRACDWHSAPFGKLQALPKHVVAVTSWPNQDEAFADIARGIRDAIKGMSDRSSASRSGHPAKPTSSVPQLPTADQAPETAKPDSGVHPPPATTPASLSYGGGRGGSAIRPLVISLHGINTRGEWQKGLTRALNEAGFDYEPLDYGHLSVPRFMRKKVREEQVDWFLEVYTKATQSGNIRPSIIAHSFGTYIVARAMEKYDLRFDRIILCGSIVRRTYPWTKRIDGGLCIAVLNDYGKLDWPSRLAEYVVRDAGRSGSIGFKDLADGKVIDRAHPDFEHSTYFYELNYTENWIPFLRGGTPRPLSAKEQADFNFRYYAIRAVLGIVIAAIAIWLVWRFWPASPPTLKVTFPEYSKDVLANASDQGKLAEYKGKRIEWNAYVVSVDQARKTYRVLPIPEGNAPPFQDIEVFVKTSSDGFSSVVKAGDHVQIDGVIDEIIPNGTRLKECKVKRLSGDND